MAKKQIVVKDALKDIRSGMSDIWIMRKYRIDARGLQSLLQKLLERGDIDPADVEERITGMTHAQLLSEEQVQHLSRELVKAKSTRPAGPTERIVKAADLARDIRAGMDDYELMDKYSLSAKGLNNVFAKLVRAGTVTQEELDDRMPSYEHTVELGEVLRDLIIDDIDDVPILAKDDSKPVRRAPVAAGPRAGETSGPPPEPDFAVYQEAPKPQLGGTVVFPIPIFNAKTPQTVGRVYDVSEKKILAVGVSCRKGDAGVFVVKPEAFGPIRSFKFAARCQWVKDETGEHVAALEITQMADADMEQLRKVIETLTI